MCGVLLTDYTSSADVGMVVQLVCFVALLSSAIGKLGKILSRSCEVKSLEHLQHSMQCSWY